MIAFLRGGVEKYVKAAPLCHLSVIHTSIVTLRLRCMSAICRAEYSSLLQ